MATENTKPAAFYGVKNVKYALRDADGKISDTAEALALPKAKSLVLNPAVNTQEVYADDIKLLAIVSDQGYTGTYGCTGQDEAFEEALGLMFGGDDGVIYGVKMTNPVRFDLYYEYTVHPEKKKPFIMKVWVYGIELGKPSLSHATNTQNVTIGDYQYPLTGYGETIMGDNDKPYTNEEGFELIALRAICKPGDTAYETFGEKPHIPMKTAA